LGKEIAVLGAGSWGTALAIHLAGKGKTVRLWARSQEAASQLSRTRENKRYLPGVLLPENVKVISSEVSQVLDGIKIVVLAVPSQALRGVLRRIRSFIKPGTILVNAAKGLETTTCFRLSQVVSEELPGFEDYYAVLSGPSHAEEVCRGMPTAVVVAARSRELAGYVQDVFITPRFRVYSSLDLVGVEFGGALKNIIALGTGIAEGLGFGDNTRAALITRGLTEIARLGVTLGANPLTFLGLAGVGDLVVTCTSRHSRNRRAGILIGQGLRLEEALRRVGMVVEGVETTRAAHQLALQHGVEMPITAQTYQVLFEDLPPHKAVSNLMSRPKRYEIEEVFLSSLNWKFFS